MRKVRTAAALALCAVCLLQTAAPVLAAEDYPAPDVSGKTVEELIHIGKDMGLSFEEWIDAKPMD